MSGERVEGNGRVEDSWLLWMDVPEDDWRKKLVAEYGLYVPGGYWQRKQEGYSWWRQMYVHADRVIDLGGGFSDSSQETRERAISTINRWPNSNRDDLELLKLRPGSPEAVAKWSPENMREHAKSLLPKEREYTGRSRPPVLVGQVWAWMGGLGFPVVKQVTSISSSSAVDIHAVGIDESSILLYGPRAPWFGPYDRFVGTGGT